MTVLEAPTAVQAQQGIDIPALNLRAMTVGEMSQVPAPKALIDGLLYRDTCAELYGPPGTFKSFLALSWALHVATGKSHGRAQVSEALPVIYVAAEGSTGMADRVDAWCEAYGVDVDAISDFYVIPKPVQLVSHDVLALAAAVVELKPGLIVFDTRARCTVGMDENSARDMGVAVDAADELRRLTGATVLTVHHSGKAGGSARGSSAWSGAMWTEMEVKRKRGAMAATVEIVKHKDAPVGKPWEYTACEMGRSLAAFPDSAEPVFPQKFPDVPAEGMLRSAVVKVLTEQGIAKTTAYRQVDGKYHIEGDGQSRMCYPR